MIVRLYGFEMYPKMVIDPVSIFHDHLNLSFFETIQLALFK